MAAAALYISNVRLEMNDNNLVDVTENITNELKNHSLDGRNSNGQIFSQKSYSGKGSEGGMRKSLVEFKNLEKQLTNHNQINAAKNLLKPMVIHDQLDLAPHEN